MSNGTSAEVPGKEIELTSAETWTVVHRETGSIPIWSLPVVDLTLTKVTGSSIGHRDLKLHCLVSVIEGCTRSDSGCVGPSERLGLDDKSDSGEIQELELQRRTNCGAGPYLPLGHFFWVPFRGFKI